MKTSADHVNENGVIVPFLKHLLDAYPNMNKPRDKTLPIGYFLLKYGQYFEFKPLRKEFFGQPKQCYYNVFNLIQEKKDLTPCFGYALTVIPIQHAWCVTPLGEVVDPTPDWDRHEWGQEYFGVPFKREFILARFVEQERAYNIIDDWEHRFPLLRGVYKERQFYKKLGIEKRMKPYPKEEEY